MWVFLPGGTRMEVADAAQTALGAELLRALAGAAPLEVRDSYHFVIDKVT